MSNILEQFKSLDTDASGVLSLDEFASVIRGHSNLLTADIVDVLFDLADLNKDGTIDYIEYLSMMPAEKEDIRIEVDDDVNIDEEMSMLTTFWELNGADNNGTTTQVIAEWIHSLHIPDTAQRLLVVMADENDDGQVDFNEFQVAYKRVMTRLRLS